MFIAGLALLVGCQNTYVVWVRAGSTADDLVLLASHERGDSEAVDLTSLRIDRCSILGGAESDAVWIIGSTDPASTGPVHRIRYGVPPSGWQSALGPEVLSAGCYLIGATGAEVIGFVVSNDGQVTEISLQDAREWSSEHRRLGGEQ